jgi:hypothetical protein
MARAKLKRWLLGLLAFLVLCAVAFIGTWRHIVVHIVHVISSGFWQLVVACAPFTYGIIVRFWQVPVAVLPLVLYALIGLTRRAYLIEVPTDPQQMEPDKQQAASLTLAGFCFTSLSLLVSFFKEAIERKENGPENIILFFCCALVCFVASYMTLRYRTKNLFVYVSDALVDNGFWCVIVGLLVFLSSTSGMRTPAIAVVALLVFYAICMVLNFHYFISYVNNPNRPHG